MATIIKMRRGTAAEWTAANPILSEGEPAYESDTGKYKIGDGYSTWKNLKYLTGSGGGGSGEGSPGEPRTSVTVVTSSLANAATESGLIPMATGYRLSEIVTSKPARVRLYATAAQRTADINRDAEDDPVDDHGLIFEFISTTLLLTAVLSPMVDGYSMEATPSIDIPYLITNLSGSSSPISVTLVWQRTE